MAPHNFGLVSDAAGFNPLAKAVMSSEEHHEKKIAALAERKKDRVERILNCGAKQRTIGLDVATLDQQVEEKRQLLAKKKAEVDALERTLLDVDKKLVLMHGESNVLRNEVERSVAAYNENVVATRPPKETLQTERPTRQGDNDAHIGPSSVQQFQGEDLAQPERIKRMREQQAAWIEQQIFEKECLKRMNDTQYDGEAEEQQQILELCEEVEQREIEQRKGIQEIARDANLAAAAYKQRREQEMKDLKNQLDAMDIEHHQSSAFLSETPITTLTNGRPNLAEFKGLDRRAYLDAQDTLRHQAQASDERKAAVKNADDAFGKFWQESRITQVRDNMYNNAGRKQLEQETQAHNERLAAMQREKNESVNRFHKVGNVMTQEFFANFGTDAR